MFVYVKLAQNLIEFFLFFSYDVLYVMFNCGRKQAATSIGGVTWQLISYFHMLAKRGLNMTYVLFLLVLFYTRNVN